MKLTKKLVACSVLAASTGLSSMAMAETPLTGNIGLTSNYIWRGVTQTGDDSAISGGIDYAHEAGFYAGTWVSSLGGGAQYEMDLYGGYGFDAGPVALDVGYITYLYQVDDVPAPDLDFAEIYVNGGWEMLSFGAAYTISKDAAGPDSDLYIYVGADFEVAKGLNLGLVYGDYDYDNDIANEDYSHLQVSLSKDDFTFAVDKNDKSLNVGDDDLRFTVSYSKSFDLL